MARLPYVDKDQLPPEKRYLLDSMAGGDEPDDDDGANGSERGHALSGSALNVYRVLANNAALLEGFWDYRATILEEGGLTETDREYIILALSRQVGAAYEWHQHVRVSLDAGFSPEEIRAIATDDLDRLAPKHATLVEYVEAYVGGRVDDELHDRLSAYYDRETIIGIGALAGLYLALARSIQALDVETEVEFVGWELENL